MGNDLINNCNCLNPSRDGEDRQIVVNSREEAANKVINSLKAFKSENILKSNLLNVIKQKSSNSNMRLASITPQYFNSLIENNAKAKSLMEKYDKELNEYVPTGVKAGKRNYKMNPVKFTNNNGQIEYYDGYYNADGKFNGLGTHIFDDKFIYKGFFQNGEYNGKGLLITDEGNSLFGDWKNNECNGKATLIIDGQLEYNGEFKNNQKNGQGIETYPDGSKYEGTFVDGEKSGKGIYTFANGEKYEGEFKNDLYDGEGVYEWPAEGRKYKGGFKEGLMDGKGENIYQDGSTYKGEYKNGMKNGKGCYTWSNGKKLYGNWLNDELDGDAKYEFNDEKLDVKFKGGKVISTANTNAEDN